MAEKDDVIRKIKKLMALAEDTSASDQEVQKSKSRYVTNEEAYKLGNQHGLEYKVKRTDLLES